MEIVDYLKGTDYLEKREKKLFEILDYIDKEGFKVFCEVIDLDMSSFYKADNLYTRVSELSNLYNEVVDCFDYLKNIELESYTYAGRRFQFKRLLTAITTAFTMLNNIFLGLGSFVILSNMSNKSYVEELESINKRMDGFEKYDFQKLSTTLINAANILKGKMEKLYKEDEMGSLDERVVFANNTIASYLDGIITEEEISVMDEDVKLYIIRMLQRDLESDSNSIYELLSMLKNKNEEEIKLTKELTR